LSTKSGHSSHEKRPLESIPESKSRNDGSERWKGVYLLVPAIFLFVISAWDVRGTLSRQESVPTERDWNSLSQYMRGEYKDSDLIVFAPRWIDPVGRVYLGDLIDLKTAGRMDSKSYGVIWEVSVDGKKSVDTKGMKPTKEKPFGSLLLRRYDLVPQKVIFDFVDGFSRARTGGGRGLVILEEVDFEPKHCIRISLTPGRKVILHYSDVPLGSEIRAYVGLADIFVRRKVWGRIHTEVKVNGKHRDSVSIDQTSGWTGFSVPTIETQKASVEFLFEYQRNKTQKRGPNPLLCFAAEARK